MFCQKWKLGLGIGKFFMRYVDVLVLLDVIVIDIMGFLLVMENGNQYIMVVGDYFSKWIEVYVLFVYIVQIVVDKFVIEFICRYGMFLCIYID